jgi:predicted HD superfamily hydrolase involved in NAD metabolism
LLEGVLSPGRFRHSLRVSETARVLAERWGEDPSAAALAGIVHDYARDIRDTEVLEVAGRLGLPVDEVERVCPALLHGKVGAALIREHLDIRDPGILRAVALHSTGGPGMTPLEMILYLADHIEPGRDMPGAGEARVAATHDLGRAVLLSMRGTLEYLLKEGHVIHPRTIDAWNWLLGEGETKQGRSTSTYAERGQPEEGS